HISVSPPAQMIATVESLLEVLDSTERLIVVSRDPLDPAMQRTVDADYKMVRMKTFVGKGEDSLDHRRVISVTAYDRADKVGAPLRDGQFAGAATPRTVEARRVRER